MKDAGCYSKKMVDDLLDQITGGDHSRMIFQLKQVGFEVDVLLGLRLLVPLLVLLWCRELSSPLDFREAGS